ncbi:hypothetical protein PUN28_016927 [Cardiocondyla obscurior]|uniref:SAM domain-containing protein n=1 Tax=Cardiocondyla obscurior TaxID=286306 RepID=A0AAW2EPY1_9HYME
MCNSVESFLKELKLDHLYPAFADNKIDDLTLLPLLSEDEVKELIPLLGERKKFQLGILSFKCNTKNSDIILDVLDPVPIESIKVAEVRIIQGVPYLMTQPGDMGSSNYFEQRSPIPFFNLGVYIREINTMRRRASERCGDTRGVVKDIIRARRCNDARVTRCEDVRANLTTIASLKQRMTKLYNKPEIARGKLIDKHRNKLSFIRKSLLMSKTPTVKREPDISKEIKDSQLWLKHNNEPHDNVMYHWKFSYSIRQIANSSICEFFEH